MKLAKVKITEFRSVQDSNEFDISDITCLVGRNESGKTAILQALYRLNPVVAPDGVFDVADDYPRAIVEEYRQALENQLRQPAVVVRAQFLLEDEDVAPIEAKLAPGVFTDRMLVASKGYDNKLSTSCTIDEANVVKRLSERAALPVKSEMDEISTLSGLLAFLENWGQQQSRLFDEATAKANANADAQAKATAIEEAKLLAEPQNSKWLRSLLPPIVQQGIQAYIWDQFLKDRFPKFLYFDEYYQMEGTVNLEQLKVRQQQNQLTSSDRPMLGLIELARLKIDELITPSRTQNLFNMLQGASTHLSRQILKYWSQNKHIQLQFDVRPALPGDPPPFRTGTNLWGMVNDTVHQASTSLGKRSKGFVWFFSFLAWYSLQSKTKQPMILLLDEPGLFLHGSAQGDFLRYMEKELKEHHQVIYSTHSPFLVDAKRFDRVRMVEDKSMTSVEELPEDKRGTKISSDVLEAGEGTLFPLQGALGYELAQTLFIGPNSLIVEGVSDLLFLQSISSILEEKGRTGLRKEWIITPVGGAEKVPTFAALIGNQPGMNVATLIDIQKKDQQKIENLYKKKLLSKSHVMTYGDFTGTEEADVEDMFDEDFYLILVNAEYKASLPKPLDTASVQGKGRVVVRVEAAFNASTTPFYNHYRPARYFSEQAGKLKTKVSEATLARFESAFSAINKLL